MNAPKNKIVDHINGNRSDNRKSNLRLCVTRQNICNSRQYSNNKSGYRGVRKRDKRWCAEISVKGKVLHLGSFDKKIDAARAYNRHALEYHGEFARLNPV